ncbi:hypothetical protein PM082_013683 [Marasmius tenuissimus]|nr:hypothetical protein PM082_013683 [Marasmius tenuissimus]
MPLSQQEQEYLSQISDRITAERVVGFPEATLSVTYFMYGLYTVLVILCVYFLRQDRFENRRFYLVSTLLLFAICTTMVVAATVFRVRESVLEYQFATTKNGEQFVRYALDDKTKLSYYTLYLIAPPLTNIVAETMLIHRCYLIWGRQKRVAIPLVVLSLVSSLFFFAASVMAALGYGNPKTKWGAELVIYVDALRVLGSIASAAVNLLVTLLTAGRIWRSNRELNVHMGIKRNTSMFSTALRIILESGAIYPTMMIVQFVIPQPRIQNGKWPLVDLYPAVVLSAGIAPTLALLRGQIAKLSEKASFKHGLAGVSDIRFNSAHLVSPGGNGTANYSITLDICANDGTEVPKLPKPLVHPHQGVGQSSSRTGETHTTLHVDGVSVV